MSSVITVLQDAKKYVEKGWTQDVFYVRKGNQHNYCALGAIRRASGARVDASIWASNFDPNTHDTAKRFVERAIAKVRKKSAHNVEIATWNDWNGRKQEDVVKIFERAIEIAEKEAAKS